MRVIVPIFFGFWWIFTGCMRSNEQPPQYHFTLSDFEVEGMTPNFFAHPDQNLLLSWIATDQAGIDHLQWATYVDEQWNLSGRIASGTDWFVNWADFPAMAQTDSMMIAHWLQKSAEGTYDYDIHIALSRDKGENWDTSFVLHRDQISAEHGFVSFMPEENNAIRAVWLDGRMTKMAEGNQLGSPNEHSGHGGGAMTLRTALIQPDGSLQDEKELDHRVCDCCQTDVAVADSVVLVVYRDRSPDEVRDMGIIRRVDGVWESPSILHQDGWQIAGCPVNGPAISAQPDGRVAVGWFTAPNNQSKVQLKISHDFGETFKAPILIAADSTLGRVDVAWMGDDIVISQLITSPTTREGQVQVTIVDSNGQIKFEEKVALMSTGRESGFPVMEVDQNKIWLTWTSIDSVTQQKNIQVGFLAPI
jgi:hypothetical protein